MIFYSHFGWLEAQRSLQLGHRESVDIDLFTDSIYNSINFQHIKGALQSQFQFVGSAFSEQPGMGLSCLIGHDDQEVIKLDLFYQIATYTRH